MNHCSDLESLYASFEKRLYRLTIELDHVREIEGYRRRMILAQVVVELDNLLLGCLREFLVSCLLGTRTVNGTRTASQQALTSEGEASAFIMSSLNSFGYQRMGSPATVPRRKEPTIRQPRDVEKVLLAAKANNIVSVQRALAFNFKFFDEIGSLRNFYCHRNKDTYDSAYSKARNWGATSRLHPDELVLKPRPGRPVPIIRDWIGEARLFFEEITA